MIRVSMVFKDEADLATIRAVVDQLSGQPGMAAVVTNGAQNDWQTDHARLFDFDSRVRAARTADAAQQG